MLFEPCHRRPHVENKLMNEGGWWTTFFEWVVWELLAGADAVYAMNYAVQFVNSILQLQLFVVICWRLLCQNASVFLVSHVH